MSIRSVRNEIANAMKTRSPMQEKEVTVGEAKRIVGEAAKGKVTEGELSVLKDLSKNGVDPNSRLTMAVPEIRGDAFYLSRDAKLVVDSFVTMHGGNDQPPFVTQAIPENGSDMIGG